MHSYSAKHGAVPSLGCQRENVSFFCKKILFFFNESLTTCCFSSKFPVRKIPAHQLFASPRARTPCAAASPCGDTLIRNGDAGHGDAPLWKTRARKRNAWKDHLHHLCVRLGGDRAFLGVFVCRDIWLWKKWLWLKSTAKDVVGLGNVVFILVSFYH